MSETLKYTKQEFENNLEHFREGLGDLVSSCKLNEYIDTPENVITGYLFQSFLNLVYSIIQRDRDQFLNNI